MLGDCVKWRSAQQAFRVCVRPCVCERGGGFIWKTLISFPTQLQWGGEHGVLRGKVRATFGL